VRPPHLALARAWRARARPSIHELTVGQVRQLTDDSVALSFAIPAELHEAYRFKAGQHVTIVWDRDGDEVRRSYSICVPEGSGQLTVAVRTIAGGAFSAYANERIRVGDSLRVMTPMGSFVASPIPGQAAKHVAVAAGSGITPILSIIATVLDMEPSSSFVLLYQNRTENSTMFREDLLHLQQIYGERLEVYHAWSRQMNSSQQFNGRLDRPRLQRFADLIAEGQQLCSVHQWFLCGPGALMDDITSLLLERDVPLSRVRRELFFDPSGADEDDRLNQIPSLTSKVTIRAGNAVTQFDLPSRGESILSAAVRLRPDIPYSCQDGICATCRAKVASGQVFMTRCSGLDKSEQEQGYVLTCQSHPLTANLLLDFDA